MSKIIYLISQPLDEWNYDRFGVQAWIDRGWDTEVWDLTPWLHPRAWKFFFETGHKLKEFDGYFPITSKSQLNARYAKLGKVECFIDFAGNYFFATWIKIRLSQMGAVRVIDVANSLPLAKDVQKCGVICKLKKVFARSPSALVEWLANKLMDRLAAPFIRPGLVVVSGEKSLNAAISAGYDQEILKAHNLGYDIYLKLAKSIESQTGDYAVFLDQDTCFDPSHLYRGFEHRPHYATPEKYFPAICNGLKKISDALEVSLCVAASPRSSYRHSAQDYFQGIPVQYNRTAELVKNCRVVVCHDTTAIEFAVLFGKPAIFVTTDELESYTPRGKSIALFASELGKSVINLDRDLDGINWQDELHIDIHKYAEYKDKYVKSKGSPEMPHWTIVIDRIESMLPSNITFQK
ncbi:MAG: hypothetical protein PHD65_00670 [Gallionella sp.]|nr:hypothetical protein [Gallionella sp.]